MSLAPNLLEPDLSADEKLCREVEKILHSTVFNSAETLRRLLSFLAMCSAQRPAEHIKVKEIATAVFGRSDEFDSQGDSVVRVHMGRLRSKLAEYYVDEGSNDELLISIPKGSYSLCLQKRSVVAPALEAVSLPASQVPSPATAITQINKYGWKSIGTIVGLMLSSALIAAWLTRTTHHDAVPSSNLPALHTFWNGFIEGNDTPLVVFSNLQLVGSLQDGMHLFRGEPADHDKPRIESWTTVGEVEGIYEVARTLALFNKHVQVKRGRLLTWDDAKDSNVVFVGGPLADTPLRDLSAFREFQFRNNAPGIPPESGAIVNANPRRGEAQIYRGPETRPFQYDYAVISFVRPSTKAAVYLHSQALPSMEPKVPRNSSVAKIQLLNC